MMYVIELRDGERRDVRLPDHFPFEVGSTITIDKGRWLVAERTAMNATSTRYICIKEAPPRS